MVLGRRFTQSRPRPRGRDGVGGHDHSRGGWAGHHVTWGGVVKHSWGRPPFVHWRRTSASWNGHVEKWDTVLFFWKGLFRFGWLYLAFEALAVAFSPSFRWLALLRPPLEVFDMASWLIKSLFNQQAEIELKMHDYVNWYNSSNVCINAHESIFFKVKFNLRSFLITPKRCKNYFIIRN